MQRFVMLELPSAGPYILTGMEVGIVLAIIGAIVGEFVGGNVGLGHLAVLEAAGTQNGEPVRGGRGAGHDRVVALRADRRAAPPLIPWHQQTADAMLGRSEAG